MVRQHISTLFGIGPEVGETNFFETETRLRPEWAKIWDRDWDWDQSEPKFETKTETETKKLAIFETETQKIKILRQRPPPRDQDWDQFHETGSSLSRTGRDW